MKRDSVLLIIILQWMVTLPFPVLTAAIESVNVRQRVNGHGRGLLHRNQPQTAHAAVLGFVIGSRSSEIQQNHYRRPVTSVTSVYGQQQQQQQRPHHVAQPPQPPPSPPDWTPIATQPVRSRNAADGVAVTTTTTTSGDFRADRYRPSNVPEPEAGRDRRFRNVDANAIIINDLLRGYDSNSNFDPTKIDPYHPPESYENTVFPEKYPLRTYTAESNLNRGGSYHHQHQLNDPAPAQNNVVRNAANADPLNVYRLGQRFNFDDTNSIMVARHQDGHSTGGVDDLSKYRHVPKTNVVVNYKPNFDGRNNDVNGQNLNAALRVENDRPEISGGANLDGQRTNSSHENRHVNANDARNEPFPRIDNAVADHGSDDGTKNEYRNRNSISNLTRNQFPTYQNTAVKKDDDGRLRPEANVRNSNVNNDRYGFRTTTAVNGSSTRNDSNRSTSAPKSESSNVDSVNRRGTVHRYGYHRGYADAENEDKPLGDGGDRRGDDDVTAATVASKNRLAPSVANREVIERRRSTADAVADSTATFPESSTATAILRQRSSFVQPASTTQPPRRRTTVASRRRPSDGSDRSGPPKNGRNRVRNNDSEDEVNLSRRFTISDGKPITSEDTAEDEDDTDAELRGGYGFEYTVQDKNAGMDFSQWERREPGRSGTVTGQYKVRLPDGRMQTVEYNADSDSGYRASVTYEGVASYPDRLPVVQSETESD